MSNTAPVVCFGAYDALALKLLPTITSSDTLQIFSKINDLKLHGAADQLKYATFEQDLWLLDGSYKLMPDDISAVHVGFMSTLMSDSVGAYSSAEIITFTFPADFTTNGMVLCFDADHAPAYVTIDIYNASSALLKEVTIYPYSTDSFRIDNFFATYTTARSVKLTMPASVYPYRYCSLLDIDFCMTTYFSGTEIREANVVEQISPLSTELPISKLDFRLFSSNPLLSMIAPSGDYTILKQRQPLYFYEQSSSVNYLIGKFFVDTWENLSETDIQIHAIDTIGLLDTMQYWGHCWMAVPTNFNDILNTILFTPAGISYSMPDYSVQAVIFSGWLPVCTYREALQQMAFAAGAYVTCSRSGIINIKKTVIASTLSSYDQTLTNAQIGQRSLSLTPLVTGVEVTSFDYNYAGVSETFFKGTMSVGAHTILFDKIANPANYSITGATMTTIDNNYCIVNVATAGTVTVISEQLLPSSRMIGQYNTGLPANTQPNVVKITNATMVSDALLSSVVTRAYSYYSQRYLQKMKLYAPTTQVGNSVLLDTVQGQHLKAIVEKMEIDLAGGFVAKVEAFGVIA